nr:hypothetical protein BaRGS_032827 [Batillaria attramentaria]
MSADTRVRLLTATKMTIYLLCQFIELYEAEACHSNPVAVKKLVEVVVNNYGNKSIVGDIMREIGRMDPRDASRDTSGARAYSQFLVELAEKVPAAMLPNVSVVLTHLDGESYSLRNGVLGMMGEILIRVLSKEGLDQNQRINRDGFFDRLQDHIHDIHAFVRSKVLQIWLTIVSEKVRQEALVGLVLGRLQDKSSQVRRYAIQLLTAVLRCNPFAAKLSVDELAVSYENEKTKLEEMMPTDQPSAATERSAEELEEEWAKLLPQLTEAAASCQNENSQVADITEEDTSHSVLDKVYTLLMEEQYPSALALIQAAYTAWPDLRVFRSDVGETDEDQSESPFEPVTVLKNVFFGSPDLAKITEAAANVSESQQVQGVEVNELSKQQVLVQYLKDSLAFARQIQEAVPIICQLLGSKNTSDVFESIEFFVTSYEFGVSAALLGIRRMLMAQLMQAGEISPQVIQVLWERFTMKIPDTAPNESRAALLLISMVAGAETDIVRSNLEVLVDEGLGPRADTDWLLAQAACQALLKLATKKTKGKASSEPFRLPPDHRMFSRLAEILVSDTVCSDLLRSIAATVLEECQSATAEEKEGEVSTALSGMLTKLLSLAGQVALQQLVYMEVGVLGELKRRLNLLGSLQPLLVAVCTNQGRYPNPELRTAATLALAKFMTVSSEFCEQQLQLMFTIMEKSPSEVIRANSIIAVGDLTFRFPNLIEPWTPHLYGRLRDESRLVRKYTLQVLTHLILNDMVKVKGQISELACCIVDGDDQISGLAKLFFHELAKKGNALYNILPDAISRLSDPEIGVEEEHFQTIMRYLFSFIQKDKLCESLVEKLCHRNERQWRDLSFCLSLLSYNEKSLRKLQENFTCFADKLVDETVYACFTSIISKSRGGFAKPEAKVLVDELEERLEQCHRKGLDEDETAQRASKSSSAAATQSKRHKTPARGGRTPGRRKGRGKENVEEDDDADSPAVRKSVQKKGGKPKPKLVFDSDEDDDNELFNIDENGRYCSC